MGWPRPRGRLWALGSWRDSCVPLRNGCSRQHLPDPRLAVLLGHLMPKEGHGLSRPAGPAPPPPASLGHPWAPVSAAVPDRTGGGGGKGHGRLAGRRVGDRWGRPRGVGHCVGGGGRARAGAQAAEPAGTHPWGAASLPVWFVPWTFQNETETGRGALSFHKVTEGTGIFLVEHVKSP